MATKCLLFLLTLLVGGCFLRPASLAIEAKIIYNMGGLQPVARTRFYLLDADPFTLRADDPAYKKRLDLAKTEDEKMMLTLSSAVFLLLKEFAAKKELIDKNLSDSDAKEHLNTIENARPLWESHLVKETTTDFEGRAHFDDLKPGQYWLLGMSETRRAFALWDVPVTLSRGTNTLLVDQNNAMYSR
jgi:antitoxin component of RelBE/YafQ-DinJ toxin-antitoxin module